MLPNWASVKGVRMNGTAMTISGKEFGEGGMEIVRNKGGDDVLFAIRDDKEMTGPNGIEVVLPSRSWVYSWLGTVRAWGPPFCVSVHCFGF